MSDRPRPIMLYLAGPIDDVSEEHACGWRREVAELVYGSAVLLFDPSTAWHGANQTTAVAVDWGNRHILAACDGLLANLSGPGRGFGTIREVEFACLHDLPVVVVGEIVSLTAHNIDVVNTLEEGMQKLLERVAERRDVPPMLRVVQLGVPEEDDDD